MANPTTNYGFVMPSPTDLVTDLPADFEVFGQAVDTQMLTNANAAIAKTIVDAKGDIIAATAADTVSRLAVGANNTVLTADSTTATGLKWATPSGNTGLSLISTASFSAVSSVSLATDSFTTTYDNYKLIINISTSSASAYLGARLRSAGTDNSTSNYSSTYFVIRQLANTTTQDSAGAASGSFANFSYLTAATPNYINVDIMQPKASVKTSYSGRIDGTAQETWISGGLFNTTTSFDSFSFFPASGTITGSYSLYGYNK